MHVHCTLHVDDKWSTTIRNTAKGLDLAQRRKCPASQVLAQELGAKDPVPSGGWEAHHRRDDTCFWWAPWLLAHCEASICTMRFGESRTGNNGAKATKHYWWCVEESMVETVILPVRSAMWHTKPTMVLQLNGANVYLKGRSVTTSSMSWIKVALPLHWSSDHRTRST